MTSKVATVDPIVSYCVNELLTKHGCHTILLYGSRARGDFNAQSDYDLLGIRQDGPTFRDARLVDGTYLDLFIFPESKILNPDESLLYLQDSRVLIEKNEIGSNFISKLAQLAQLPPMALAENELAARRVWAHKMLDRTLSPDIEGNYRRTWLQMSLLEDYFLLRRLRFQGSKKSFRWLKENDPSAYLAFENVLRSPTDHEFLTVLVGLVTRSDAGRKLR